MAELLLHSLRLRRLIRRWRIVSSRQSEGHISEFASWVQPGAQLDRDWADDDRLMFGFTADAGAFGPGNFPACAIFAADREVHLHEISFHLRQTAAGTSVDGGEVNIVTPDSSYNPVFFVPGQFFPFMQTNRNPASLELPHAAVIGGIQNVLYAITVGGIPVNPALGPRYMEEHIDAIAFAVTVPQTKVIHKRSDPPIILPPGKVLAVQHHNPPALDVNLVVNYLLSEREV